MSARPLRLALITVATLLLAAPLVALPTPTADAVLARPHIRLWTRLLPGFLLVGLALRRRQSGLTAAR